MGRALRACVILVAAAALMAGCTVKETTPPTLAGPSELGLSLTLGANPDSLYQDGNSQSVITIQARDSNGAAVQNLTLQLAIAVDGVVGDVGALTNKRPVTASDGRAVVTYTAPAFSDQMGRVVSIMATPLGTNYANSSTPRSVQIQLVPPGTVAPPNNLVAGFAVSPANPAVLASVLFNASPCGSSNDGTCTVGTIVAYSWNFGDGTTGSGQIVSHAYSKGGNYQVTLTVTGSSGQTATATRVVLVGGGAAPTADFAFSPTSPLIGQEVYFNASASKAGTGRTIVNYEWDFGTGARGVGALVKNTFSSAGTFVVTLLVTDDIGQTAAKSQSITIR